MQPEYTFTKQADEPVYLEGRLYLSYNLQTPEIDPGDFSGGSLRAVGTEGDDSGDPNKVPIDNAWALIHNFAYLCLITKCKPK